MKSGGLSVLKRSVPKTLAFAFGLRLRFKTQRSKTRVLLGARLRGRTATQRSKKGSEKVLGRVLGRGSQKGSEKGACYGFYSKKGSQKGF